MRVVVFGASGATGRELVAQALTREHEVTAFVRNPSRLGSRAADVRLVKGDVMDPSAVACAVEGQNAVLCALGAATPLRRDRTLVQGVRHIVDAMDRGGVRRLVYLSFLGVRDGRTQLSFIGRVIVSRLLRNVVADHEAKEEIIRRSGLDWIIVRPPRLTNGQRTGVYREGADIRATSLLPRISRADLADFMLRQLSDDTYVRKTPAVMY